MNVYYNVTTSKWTAPHGDLIESSLDDDTRHESEQDAYIAFFDRVNAIAGKAIEFYTGTSIVRWVLWSQVGNVFYRITLSCYPK